MRHPAAILLALLLLPFLAACHERRVTRVAYPPYTIATPDPSRYGRITLQLVREVNRPNALGRFPDGGVSRERAVYYEVSQLAPDGSSRLLGRLPLAPVRRAAFGDILDGGADWPEPDLLRWRVRHGWLPGKARTDTATIRIPPLD